MTVTVREGQFLPLTIRQGKGRLRGQVVNPNPNMRYRVYVVTDDPTSPWYNGQDSVIKNVEVIKDGSFQIDKLAAGKYRAILRSEFGLFQYSANVRAVGSMVVGSVPFECSDDQPTSISLDMPMRKLAGRALDDTSSEPLARVRVSVYTSNRYQSTGFHTVTDRDGYFQFSAVPSLLVSLSLGLPGYAKAEKQFAPGTTAIEAGSILMSKTVLSGVVFNIYSEPGGFLWADYAINFCPRGSNPKTIGQDSAVAFDDVFAGCGLAKVNCGHYLVVLSSTKQEKQQIEQIVLPDVEVRPGKYTEVGIHPRIGTQIELICEPGSQQNQLPAKGAFWLKDEQGTVWPLPGQSLRTKTSLAPGVYTFGITLTSGEEKSVDFYVPANSVEPVKVMLSL
jgi:hypothetical protein